MNRRYQFRLWLARKVLPRDLAIVDADAFKAVENLSIQLSEEARAGGYYKSLRRGLENIVGGILAARDMVGAS